MLDMRSKDSSHFIDLVAELLSCSAASMHKKVARF